MSKIVMRVVMVGWIAMLGTNAEAHFHKIGGTAYWCSFCFLLHSEEEPKFGEIGAHEQFDLDLQTNELEYSCRGKTEVVTTPLNLRVRKDIVRGDITRQFDNRGQQVGLASSGVLTVVAHTALLEAHLCEDGGKADDVLIRATRVKVTFYADGVPYGEIATFDCKFPKKWNLFGNPPFVGAPYDCKAL